MQMNKCKKIKNIAIYIGIKKHQSLNNKFNKNNCNTMYLKLYRINDR